MKRATLNENKYMLNKDISIHALVKRATYDRIDTRYNAMAISIHALVKRATTSMLWGHGCDNISIHALVKRATL